MKILPLVTAILAAAIISFNSLAQSDSTYYDLGRIKLRKEFTQAITVKGRDLEKVPFANLADALNTWFYGTLTGSETLVYVVDGNMITDANAYSIFDIEEITLVQNASLTLNGVNNFDFLVLITTKHPTGQHSLQFGAQTALVTRKPQQLYGGSEEKAETNVYQQYFVSMGAGNERTKFRITGNYLRDAMPSYKTEGYDTKTPLNLNRFRLGSEFSSKISSKSDLALFANFVPQYNIHRYDLENFNGARSYSIKNKQMLFSAGAQFNVSLLKNLTSSTSFTYTTLKTNNTSGHESLEWFSEENLDLNSNMLLMRETLSSLKTVGLWTMTPSLNFSFRYYNRKQDIRYTSKHSDNPFPATHQYDRNLEYGRSYTLTPTLDVTYDNSFNLTGGIVSQLSYLDRGRDIKRIFPFVSSSVDVVQLFKRGSVTNLKFYTSIASHPILFDNYYQLEDLENPTQSLNNRSVVPNLDPSKSKTSFQFGSSLGLFHNRVRLDYNHEKRESSEIVSPYGYQTFTTEGTRWYNRFRISGKISKDKLSWQPALSLTRFKSDNKRFSESSGPIKHDDKSWIGGFVNRIVIGDFQIGLDLLLKLNEKQFLYSSESTEAYNSFGLQNLYFGYQFNSAEKIFDVYLTGRNILTNDDAKFYDTRRYYGLGVNVKL